MEIITGYTGKPHVTSEQDRDVNIGVVGEESYVLQTGMQLAAEVSSNNEIKIRDGVLMHQGCTASIKKNTYDSLTIINGSQGMKRIDLIVARYEKNQDNGIESLDLKVIQGTPAESTPTVPEYTEGDIQAGDYVADMPMYQVIIDGLNITEVKKVFEVAPGIDALKKEIAELNSKLKNAGLAKCLAAHASALYIPTTNTININDYRCFVLQCCDSTGNRVLATDLIFPDQIAYGPAYEHTAVYAPEASNYIAYCYFGTDKKIYTKARSQYSSVRLYGIPKN